MTCIPDILAAIEEYKKKPEGIALELQLNLSQILLSGLRRKNWEPCDLATATGFSETHVIELLHANINCSFADVGLLLFALGINVTLVRQDCRTGKAKSE